MLATAVVVYVATLLLAIALSFVLLAFPDLGQGSGSALQASTLASALLVLAVTAYGAYWAAHRVEYSSLLHGILVGLVVALLSFLLDALFIKAITLVGLLLYLLMVAAGWLGGVLGSRTQERS